MTQQGARTAIDMLLLAFNPHQRRDSRGRWVKMADSELLRPRQGAKSRPPRDSSAIWSDLPFGAVKGKAEKQLKEMFSFEDPATGLHTAFVDARVWRAPDQPPRITVELEIRNSAGDRVGTATRVFGTDPETGERWVEHANFRLNEGERNGGFSTRWLTQMEDRYRKAGVDRIDITATKVGGYAWAKAGFDLDNAGTAWSRAGAIRGGLISRGQLTPELDTQLNDMLKRSMSGDPEQVPTPMEMAMLGWTPGAETWPGKEGMLNSYWKGVKRL